ncbi:MAG: inner membrane CreD family protein [Deltaproteobacteria bacterium]|nr:inner membrane CreD family protein [Deltaproteobacteria bacterium]
MQSTSPIRQLARNRIIIKIFVTAALTLLLLVPLASIQELVEERSLRRQEVVEQLGSQWGPAATLRGPLLVVPTRGGSQHRYIVPEELSVDGSIPVTERYRGIFRLPSYRARLKLAGRFSIPAKAPSGERDAGSWSHADGTEDLDWDKAAWVLIVGHGQSPPIQARLVLGEDEGPGVSLQSASSDFGIPATILHAPVRAARFAGGALDFSAQVDAFGSEALHIAPLGRKTHMALTSDWPHPSFDGDRLPSERTVEDRGFRASWDLDASLMGLVPAHTGAALPRPMLESPEVSLRFVEAISHYQQVTRGVKYALLVIVLTFVSFFLFELLARLDIHPVQYLLVGCALTLFYLLLLSLAEHLPFTWSYLIAAGAVVAMIALYARAVLARSARAAALGCGLGAVYGLLYVILQEESLALLAGSWALFAILALLMYLTRRIDWAAFGQPRPSGDPVEPASPAA